LATLPPSAKVQSLFDARQWQAMQQQFNQAKAMKQQMLNAGYLAQDDLEPKPAEVQR
jgi:hypothetical protein